MPETISYIVIIVDLEWSGAVMTATRADSVAGEGHSQLDEYS